MVRLTDRDRIISRLHVALEPFGRIGFAVLFGSAVEARLREDSDLDLAVYFATDSALHVEEQREFDEEPDVQIAAERVVDRTVDLLVLNRAPATVCSTALTTGVQVMMRTPGLYTRYFLAVTKTATEFDRLQREFRRIREQSRSLRDADRARLEQIIDFVGSELEDRAAFQDMSLEHYRSDRHLRRDVDRWAEMLINATVDIAKIVLASEHREVPRTYGQILADLRTIDAFAPLADQLRGLATLRNVLAHEYLDLRYTQVKRFVDQDSGAVAELAERTSEWLAG